LHVSVTYLYLPGPTQRSFRAADLATREAALAGRHVRPAGGARAGEFRGQRAGAGACPPNLQLSGSKSIGVSFGRNREATLDQSLRVEAAGELGEGLRVNAVLADDNLPVTASGSTEVDWADLSKVFIDDAGARGRRRSSRDFSLQRGRAKLVDVAARSGAAAKCGLHHGEQSLAVGAGLAIRPVRVHLFPWPAKAARGLTTCCRRGRVDFSTIGPRFRTRLSLDGSVPMRRGENQGLRSRITSAASCVSRAAGASVPIARSAVALPSGWRRLPALGRAMRAGTRDSTASRCGACCSRKATIRTSR
jgi:hypothetical protein